MSAPLQWHDLDDGGGYIPTGKTTDDLPPGIYDISKTMQGQIVFVPVRARMDEIIRFPETPIDDVIFEIETFWSREEDFVRHGMPFKRGLLLHGPPGSGKSTTLQFIARDVVNRGGIVILFGGVGIFMSGYRVLRSRHPEMPVVVFMEDLDEILNENNAGQSSILNLLDGVESTHKVVFLATTNYPERLQERITNRPSRFDRRFLIGHPNAQSRRMYLETIMLEGDEIDVGKMISDTEGMSLAHLKELFVSTVILKSDYGKTLAALRKMTERMSSVYDNESMFEGLGRGYS